MSAPTPGRCTGECTSLPVEALLELARLGCTRCGQQPLVDDDGRLR
jgi:hypothetical protein